MSNIQAALVQAILAQCQAYNWTVQGFGMVRTKLGGVGRIHIWDSRLRNPSVSDIHAHPWDLHSTIISGELINQRFDLIEDNDSDILVLPYLHSRIATGEGGGLRGETKLVRLYPYAPEFYSTGDDYTQKAEEIHRTIPIDGTVTLLRRQMGEPLEETSVFWPQGLEWGSAEPRPAKEYEVNAAVGLALARWTAGERQLPRRRALPWPVESPEG